MAYVIPTASDFKTRFTPDFNAVDDARVTAAIAEAARFVDTSWLEPDYAIAIRYLTAHLLVTEGALRPATLVPTGMASGPITSEKLGDASVSYGSSSGAGSSDQDLMTTTYGQKFVAIRNANNRGPILI